MGKISVFLDSNVLFSAAYSGEKSVSYILFELQNGSFINIFISNLVLRETTINLEYKKPDRLDFLNNLINKTIVLSDVMLDLPVLKSLPQADCVILSTAIFHGVDYFLTGNIKDFKSLYGKTIGDTTVLKPRDFLCRV